MKPKLFIIALLALLVASCTLVPLPEPEKEEGKIVTIRVKIPEETRVAYDDATRTLSWQVGDQLLMAGYNGTTFLGSKIFNYDGTGYTFSGEPVPGATTYKAYYPATVQLNEDGVVQPFPATFWHQKQVGDNSMGHLRNKLLLFDEEANALDQTFNLTLKNSIIRFNLSGIPQAVGALSHLIWRVETAPGVTKSVMLNVENVNFSASTTTLTAFLAFDPAVMKIAVNGKMRIALLGTKWYVWNNQVAPGKTYSAGNRYKGTVNGGWVEQVINNPLYYVAVYNVNPAGDDFVSNLTDCRVSGHFTWNDAVTRFNTNNSIPGYHLPSKEEWFGIVPEHATSSYYVHFTGPAASYNDVSENVVVQDMCITVTGDYRTTANNVSYALRYKGTNLRSAWKYEMINFCTDSCYLKITSRNIEPSVTITDVANETYWDSNDWDDVIRYLPAGGVYSDWDGQLQAQGTGGYYWASTECDVPCAWYMSFGENYAVSYSGCGKTNRFTVRLFAPGN